MKQVQGIFSFNRGLVSPFALAREDIKRVGLGAALFNNYIARVMGAMVFRPGRQYLGNTASNNAARFIPFVHSTTDTALLEITNTVVRPWVADALISRVAVTATVTNGTFTGSLAGWTTADNAGCTSSWLAGDYLSLLGNGTGYAITYQLITLGGGDSGKEHALRIVVTKGFVHLRVGSTLHGDEYINDTVLGVGTHSLALTPTTNFYVEFKASLTYASLVDSCSIEGAGVMSLPGPWLAADLDNIRYDESVDVVFIACAGYQQQKIERRGTRSWSVVTYEPQDGPFRIQNVSPITISSSAIIGDVTLTASSPLWYSSHVGSLYSLSSVGQTVTKTIGALNDATASIQVTGAGNSRAITINISALSATGDTVILEQSFDNASWVAVPAETWTANVVTSYNDGLTNQVVYYRLKCSVYVGGAPVAQLFVPVGTVYGVVKITAFSSSTSVTASVLLPLGGTAATSTWEEGQWSNFRGWPTCVRFHEGRLWWFGKGTVNGSVSDGYYSFNENTIGDAGPINRTIGSGPVDTINWAISGFELAIGAQGAEISVRSDSLGNPLTPTNFNMKTVSTQGSASVDAIKVDQTGFFVQRSGVRIYQLSPYNPYTPTATPTDLTALNPELGLPGIVRIAVQRQPDTRIHCVRSDGTVMLGVFDQTEGVLCWSTISGTGLIQDVVILPGQNGVTEDQVYYVVRYNIGGATKFFLEKWALETECRGGTLNKQADAFIIYSGAAVNVIPGLTHLEGQQVVVWADGIDRSPGFISATTTQTSYTVSGGQITLAVGVTVTNAIVGLPYTGQWQSTKLGEGINGMPALTAKKNMAGLGLVCAYIHPKGLQYGNSFDAMYDMPEIEQGDVVPPNTVRTTYDESQFLLDGGWSSDMRLCIQSQAPRPCSILGAVCESDVSR